MRTSAEKEKEERGEEREHNEAWKDARADEGKGKERDEMRHGEEAERRYRRSSLYVTARATRSSPGVCNAGPASRDGGPGPQACPHRGQR